MSVTVTIAATSQNLTTKETVKVELGIASSTTDHDAALDRMIGAVSAQIASALGYALGRETVTEALSGVARKRLLLSRTPLNSVSQIRLDGIALTADDWVIEDRERGFLWRDVGWAAGNHLLPTASLTHSPERGEELWAVDYIGGYWLPSFSGSAPAGSVLLPPDLEQLAIEMVTARFRMRGRDAQLKSESIGDWSGSWRDGRPPEWDHIIARHARIASA